jgi:hypothetical protein
MTKRRKLTNAISTISNQENVDVGINSDNDAELIDLTLQLTNADRIVGRRINDLTRKGYQSCFAYITKFCSKHIPEAVDVHGNLIIPMQHLHFKAFLGSMGTEREDGTVKSKSAIQKYISVIKFYCKEKDERLSEASLNFADKFCQGHKNDIATKKEKGIMKNFEGKVPITYQI